MAEQRSSSNEASHLERVARLVSDLEQELAIAPSDSARVMALKHELALLKHTLFASDPEVALLERQLQGTHSKLGDFLASAEGELLRDTPYLTELGRILGLV
jgi:hypothetical protein